MPRVPDDTAAFWDARCATCKRRIGWFGTSAQRPKCPSGCDSKAAAAGAPPDRAAREAAARERLATIHPREATSRQLIRMRQLAGLKFGEVVTKAGIERDRLFEIEDEGATLTPAEADALAALYAPLGVCRG